ncbi:hypothetical protein BASA81_012843 [Batrachochytrium salamandrivorans]|nr:hypothetical protein BASA81_012843 [Batrachochytrium salamandrivorans]
MNKLEETKHPLQAVVLADSFTRTFRPMTLEMPKVLMPVAGTPMIEYSLEMLANAGVREIVVVSCWHAQIVRDYLHKSRWRDSKSPKVVVVSFPQAQSAGDALRDLAQTGQIVSDPFVLMSGDVVSNVRLAPIIKLHELNPDKRKIMTSLFKRVDNSMHIRNFDDDLIVAMNATTKQMLLYETEGEDGEVDEENHASHSICIAQGFEAHPKIELRSDFRDCHIDICSPICLDLIRDEFHEDLRLDFVRKEVKRGEEFGHTFYCHELVEDYAARVHALRDYDHVCRDVLNRWVYPLVPDNNWNDPNNGTCWFSHASWLYRESGVLVDRTAVLGRRTMIGRNTKIGANVHIHNSILGQNVVVKDGAVIKDSYIWDGVVVESGVKMDRALVCDDARIGQDCVLERGSVVSYKVVLAQNTTVPAFSRLTISSPFLENVGGYDDDEDEIAPATVAAVAGELREFVIEEEPEFVVPTIPQWILSTLNEMALPEGGKRSPYTVMGSMGCDELDGYKRTWDDVQHDRNPISVSNASEESLPLVVSQLVLNLISRGDVTLDDDDYYSSVAMELKGLRASRLSCTFEDIAAMTFAVLLQTGLSNDFKPQTIEEMKIKLGQVIKLISPLLVKFSQDILNKQTTVQLALIEAAEMVFLLGPTQQSLVPELILDLPHLEYILEESEALSSPEFLKQVLDEARAGWRLFSTCLVLLGDNDVLDVEALELYCEKREAMDSELEFLLLFQNQSRNVKFIIQRWRQDEEEESEEESEGESESEEEE